LFKIASVTHGASEVTRTCDRLVSSGCGVVPPERAAGNYPGEVAVDSAVGTAYVAAQTGVSVIPLAR
jgi:hypothetical protein